MNKQYQASINILNLYQNFLGQLESEICILVVAEHHSINLGRVEATPPHGYCRMLTNRAIFMGKKLEYIKSSKVYDSHNLFDVCYIQITPSIVRFLTLRRQRKLSFCKKDNCFRSLKYNTKSVYH